MSYAYPKAHKKNPPKWQPNTSFPQLGKESVQVDTEERRREDCTLADSILDSEAGAFHRVPSDKAGLVDINSQDQAQDDWWNQCVCLD
jgi:hypothetical protein